MRWDSGYTVKGRIDGPHKVWYGEMRIPFRAIDARPPQRGRELRIGLFRITGAGSKHAFYARGCPSRRNLLSRAPGVWHPPPAQSVTAVLPRRQRVTLATVDRRIFLQVAAARPAAASPADEPAYRVVTAYKPAAQPGMPGPYPGQVVRVHSENSIDSVHRPGQSGARQADDPRAACGRLPAMPASEDAWARFISSNDVVGIKVNCSGAPHIRSSPEVVAAIAENLLAVGVPAKHIYCYERFDNQLQSVGYPKYLPEGVNVYAAGNHPQLDSRLRSEDLRGDQLFRRRRHPLELHPSGHRNPHQDRQRAQHEGAPGRPASRAV